MSAGRRRATMRNAKWEKKRRPNLAHHGGTVFDLNANLTRTPRALIEGEDPGNLGRVPHLWRTLGKSRWKSRDAILGSP